MIYPANSPACDCSYCANRGGVKARTKSGTPICSGTLDRYVALYGEFPSTFLPLRHFDEVTP